MKDQSLESITGHIDRPLPEEPWGIPEKIWLITDSRDPVLQGVRKEPSWSERVKKRIRQDAQQWLPALAWNFPLVRDPEEDPDSRGILEAFLELAEAESEQFVHFAKKYGVLLLCEHGLPYVSNTHSRPICCPIQLEPLKLWREYARLFALLNDISYDLRQEDKPEGTYSPAVVEQRASKWTVFEEFWRLLAEEWQGYVLPKGFHQISFIGPGDKKPRRGFPNPQEEVHHLGLVLSHLLELGGVKPVYSARIVKDGFEPEIRLTGGGAFGAVVRQLAWACTGKDGFVNCAGCGKPFTPLGRRPRSGERSWCDGCQKKKKGQAVKDFNRRKKKAGEMYKQGISTKRIVKRLGKRYEETIQKWVKDWGTENRKGRKQRRK